MLLCMAGCGKEQQLSANDNRSMEEETMEWSVSHSSMMEQYEMAAVDEEKIYACRYSEDGIIVSTFEKDQMKLINTIALPEIKEVTSLSINAANDICIFGNTGNGYTFCTISESGEKNFIEDIQVENLGNYADLKNIYTDKNGFYYLWYEMSVPCSEVYENGEEDVFTALDRIYVKDQQMNTIVYEEVPDSYGNSLVCFAFDDAGIPMMLAIEGDEYGDNKYYLQQLRTTEREEYERNYIEVSDFLDFSNFYNLANGSLFTFTQDGLLYLWDGALYLYHISDSSSEKLLDLASAGILEEDIIYLGMNDGAIEIVDNYKNFQQSEYTVIREGKDERTNLTLGVMTLQPELKEIVASYNRYQNKTTIKPVIYAEDYNYEAGYERLSLDIIQGKAPDLISVYGIEYESLAKAGSFTDLYTFMNQDNELNADRLVSSVLEVYEQDDQLYTMAPTFRLHTMWGAGSVVEGKNGVTMDEMMQLLEDNGGDINSIYGFSADESPLTTLCSFHMDEFIDWSEGTCDFTKPEFEEILEFVKKYEGKTYESLQKAIRDKEILLTVGLIGSVEDYRLESEIYGEKIQCIGYPTENGTGIAVLFSGDELAINSKSSYQQEAWEFLKYFIQNGYYGEGFPLEKDMLEDVFNKSLEEEFVNEDGEQHVVAKRSYMEKNDSGIQVYKCEPEDVEEVRTLIQNVSDKFRYNVQVQKIIDEEVEANMQNQKEIEEICSIIQSRVSLYLDERK